MYAKLDNGRLIPAPRRLHIGSNNVYNPTPEQLVEAGYKPVEYSEPPEAPEGYSYEPGWAEQEGTIVQTWTLVELPPETDVDPYEVVERLEAIL